MILENNNLTNALASQYHEASGVGVFIEGVCVALAYTMQHVHLYLQNGTQVSAKLLVAADGVNSWVQAAKRVLQ